MEWVNISFRVFLFVRKLLGAFDMASINLSTYNLPPPSLEGTPGGIKVFVCYYFDANRCGYEVGKRTFISRRHGCKGMEGDWWTGSQLCCHLHIAVEGTGFEE